MFLPIFFRHPLTRNDKIKSFRKYFAWHLFKIFNRQQTDFTLIDNIKVNLKDGESAALVNYYTGLYEFEEMCFIMHFLRKNDLFIDVGANIGIYSLIASGHNGCKSIAFEPVPRTFEKLCSNIQKNQLEKLVTVENIGIGSKDIILKFTNGADSSINGVADTYEKNVIDVQVKRLDEFIYILQDAEAVILKIDVEGFESEVLIGAQRILSNNKVKAIIIEINGSGKKFDVNENMINDRLTDLGFEPYYYDPFNRIIHKEIKGGNWGNKIYLRDVELINQRILSALSFNILNYKI